MFSHHCPTGDISYPAWTRSLVGLHNSSGVGRIAYLRGKPASEWIQAVSRGRTAAEDAPPASAAA